MRAPKQPKPDHVQVHTLTNGNSALEVTIVTGLETSSASIKGLLGCPDVVPYSSVEEARLHWEHLTDHGWEHTD
jgi:hypothetical protein